MKRILDPLIAAAYATIKVHLEPVYRRMLWERVEKHMVELFHGANRSFIEETIKEQDNHLSSALAFAKSQ